MFAAILILVKQGNKTVLNNSGELKWTGKQGRAIIGAYSLGDIYCCVQLLPIAEPGKNGPASVKIGSANYTRHFPARDPIKSGARSLIKETQHRVNNLLN